ncbi:AAA family ATPase [Campylobacter upsaliensis]|nr:AAA family ATPase [Campylobacter upsaliensis]
MVKRYDASLKQLIIKLNNKYDALFDETKEKELKIKEWAISYDYQVREILWSKQNKALEELKKNNTQIPNLLRKINESTELKENEQREIESYFNENLDENQQEAVKKALSLERECEILLIQGPPGTGKTTTITEIIKQYQKFHKHYKILITSQSNQAVDNVLEKICVSEANPNGEDKIFRIGNDERKMSEIAKQYTPEKVLDKILKENRERIKQMRNHRF